MKKYFWNIIVAAIGIVLLAIAFHRQLKARKHDQKAFDDGVLVGISAGIDCYTARLLGNRPDLESNTVTLIFEYAKTNRQSAIVWDQYHGH